MSVHIDKIRLDGGTQSRAALNEATVAEYAEAMADPDTVFPPVIVYFDGKDYWLADGFHRVAAWARIGRTEIPADVKQGDVRRARLHSVAANAAHGLRRTNDDKRRAVMTLLEDAEWSAWSDREIARRCGVSPSFVGGLRGASVHDGQIAETRTVERNGTTYQQNTANIGEPAKKRAAPVRLIEDEPEPNMSDEDRINRKLRLSFRKMTPQGQQDDWIGIKRALHEEKVKRRRLEFENQKLKEQVKDFTGDQADVIRRQAAIIKAKDAENYRANENLLAEKRKNYALNKRVKELEAMPILLNGGAGAGG